MGIYNQYRRNSLCALHFNALNSFVQGGFFRDKCDAPILGCANEINVKMLLNLGYIALKNQPVTDKLIFWQDAKPSVNDIPPSLVDPEAEAARIKKDQAEGKPINTGMVPTIEQKTNPLDKIF